MPKFLTLAMGGGQSIFTDRDADAPHCFSMHKVQNVFYFYISEPFLSIESFKVLNCPSSKVRNVFRSQNGYTKSVYCDLNKRISTVTKYI